MRVRCVSLRTNTYLYTLQLLINKQNMSNKKLTSVKINPELWDEFRINTIKMKFSFQKLSERAIYLYNNDPEFRKLIHNTKLPDFE
jgi:hypothetical protein